MELTLPSGKKMKIKSKSWDAQRKFEKIQIRIGELMGLVAEGDEDAAKELVELRGGDIRYESLRELYPGFFRSKNIDSRDVYYLATATEDYSKGVPEETIKNSLMSGGQEATQTD